MNEGRIVEGPQFGFLWLKNVMSVSEANSYLTDKNHIESRTKPALSAVYEKLRSLSVSAAFKTSIKRLACDCNTLFSDFILLSPVQLLSIWVLQFPFLA